MLKCLICLQLLDAHLWYSAGAACCNEAYCRIDHIIIVIIRYHHHCSNILYYVLVCAMVSM